MKQRGRKPRERSGWLNRRERGVGAGRCGTEAKRRQWRMKRGGGSLASGSRRSGSARGDHETKRKEATRTRWLVEQEGTRSWVRADAPIGPYERGMGFRICGVDDRDTEKSDRASCAIALFRNPMKLMPIQLPPLSLCCAFLGLVKKQQRRKSTHMVGLRQ